MSDREQTHRSAFPDPNAATYARTASTHSSSRSETTPAAAGHPEPETASAAHSATASMCRSPSGCNRTPTSRSRQRGVPAPACCDSDRVAASASPSCTGAPATGCSAASSPVHAGASGQPSWRRHLKRNRLTEHKQPKRGHSAAGQYLSAPAGGERGDSQSGALSAYCNYPGAQSGCNGSSESSSRHRASRACCRTSCSACHVHSDPHNQLHARCSSTERRRKAAGAHSPASCSASSQQSPSGSPDVICSTSSPNSTDHHCEWPGFCLATHEDL